MSEHPQWWQQGGDTGLPIESSTFALSEMIGKRRVHQPRTSMYGAITSVAFISGESIWNVTFPVWLPAWFSLPDGLRTLLVSNDLCSMFGSAVNATALRMSVLGDREGTVGRAYGVEYDDITRRRIYLSDSTNRIRRIWSGRVDLTGVYLAAQQHLDSNVEALFGAKNDNR